MALHLSDSPTACFARDGFLAPIPVLSPAEADRVRARFDALEAAEGPDKCRVGLKDRHFDQRFVWDLATHPAILDAVSSVLGPHVMLLATHFFCKYPAEGIGSQVLGVGTGDPDPNPSPSPPTPNAQCPTPSAYFVAWHQDVTYWGLEPPEALTAWYAVDDSDVENGCMRVLPGTHRAGIRKHGTAAQSGNMLSINQEVSVTPEEEASAVDLVLQAGEISLHDGALIHGSNPNRSARRRCGLTIRYVRPSTRQTALNSFGQRYQALLVRGEDRFHHFDVPALTWR